MVQQDRDGRNLPERRGKGGSITMKPKPFPALETTVRARALIFHRQLGQLKLDIDVRPDDRQAGRIMEHPKQKRQSLGIFMLDFKSESNVRRFTDFNLGNPCPDFLPKHGRYGRENLGEDNDVPLSAFDQQIAVLVDVFAADMSGSWAFSIVFRLGFACRASHGLDTCGDFYATQ